MSFKAITVNTPTEQEAHIFASDDAAIYQSIFGSDGVFNIGNKFSATILNNNSVRISDGVLCVGGHVGRIQYADYEDMVIENGMSGYNRNDVIYASFVTEGNSDVFSIMVKKGVATTDVAKDPEIEMGDLYAGDVQREYPLWRVRLEGLSIVGLEKMFKVISTMPELVIAEAAESDIENIFSE